jgi:hypothetical protein
MGPGGIIGGLGVSRTGAWLRPTGRSSRTSGWRNTTGCSPPGRTCWSWPARRPRRRRPTHRRPGCPPVHRNAGTSPHRRSGLAQGSSRCRYEMGSPMGAARCSEGSGTERVLDLGLVVAQVLVLAGQVADARAGAGPLIMGEPGGIGLVGTPELERLRTVDEPWSSSWQPEIVGREVRSLKAATPGNCSRPKDRSVDACHAPVAVLRGRRSIPGPSAGRPEPAGRMDSGMAHRRGGVR